MKCTSELLLLLLLLLLQFFTAIASFTPPSPAAPAPPTPRDAMPIPFEALLPLGIVAVALTVGGTAIDYTQRYFNNGKVLPSPHPPQPRSLRV